MTTGGRPVLFVVGSAAAQLVGLAAGVAASAAVRPEWPHAAAALAVSAFLGHPLSWRVMNGALPLAAAFVADGGGPPGWVAGVAAAVLCSVYVTTFWTRVPYYPTAPGVAEGVARFCPGDRPFSFLEAGCGFGGLLERIARSKPEGRFTGVEVSPLCVAVAAARVLPLPNVRVKWSGLWSEDLGGYDVVYAFLSPAVSDRLASAAAEAVDRGTVVVVNSFPLPGLEPAEVWDPDAGGQRLYVYRRG